jgi:hypothetical protein
VNQSEKFELVLKLLKVFGFGWSLAAAAAAQEVEGWQFTETAIQGVIVHSASIAATRSRASGDEDYPPVLSLSCTTGDALHWKQQVRFEEPLTSRGLIYVDQWLDGRKSERAWTVTGAKRVFTRFDTQFAGAIKSARQLTLAWNWGWSWLWLPDEAEFNLAGAGAAIYTLAKKCGIPEP